MAMNECTLFDVLCCREVLGTTSPVDVVGGLVYPNVVNSHLRRKRKMCEIHGAEAGRHSKVDDYVLQRRQRVANQAEALN